MVESDQTRIPEWPEALDVRRLLEQGWRPTPFHQFIVKIHSRCNLRCDYCYIYEMADQGWKAQPRRMARPVVEQVARRIAEHARANRLDRVSVIIHGGEPLLAGVDHLRFALATIRGACEPDVRVDFSLQTNAVLINEFFLEVFLEFGVEVGVSMDGDREGHDRHRLRRDGEGSYDDVRTGLYQLTGSRYQHLFSGFLATIDLANDPVRTYEALLEWNPPGVDFLLPHGNWDNPPPGRPPDDSTPYADWLIAVFDRWYGAKIQETSVRLPGQIMRLLLGRGSSSEAVGLGPVAMAVIETNGQIEQVDSLKSAFDGASGTFLHVSRDPFDTALHLPSIAARQIGTLALATGCRTCDLHETCGGGLYPHRYRTGTGFRNASVYCRDLYRFIDHIRTRLISDLDGFTTRGRS
ncbi:FxsB family cyclophane-forming radical SAM/SPASM peptide maturase [Actinocorallia longicatena]|uniref:FxsB family radical SAM/SPASM domain protein n=1 Tax=Actinocorallia longicatena TaxID=111803 RepID=A0ABP6Q523_9ACTN